MAKQGRGVVRKGQFEAVVEEVTAAHADAMAKSLAAFYEVKVEPVVKDVGRLRAARLRLSNNQEAARREREALEARLAALDGLWTVRAERWVSRALERAGERLVGLVGRLLAGRKVG